MNKIFFISALITVNFLTTTQKIYSRESFEDSRIKSAKEAVDKAKDFSVIIKYGGKKDTTLNRGIFAKDTIQILPAIDTSYSYDLIISQSDPSADSINRFTTRAIDRVYTPSEWRRDSILLKAERMCKILNKRCILAAYCSKSIIFKNFLFLESTDSTIIIGKRVSSAEIKISQERSQGAGINQELSVRLYSLICSIVIIVLLIISIVKNFFFKKIKIS